MPLYNAEALADALPGGRVIVTEGELATDALTGIGVLAVGTVTGAGSTPSAKVLAALRGFEVALWADHDCTAPGFLDTS